MTSTTNGFLLPIKMFVTNCECFESEHATLWNCNLLNHNEMNDKHYSVPIIPQLFELAPSYLSFLLLKFDWYMWVHATSRIMGRYLTDHLNSLQLKNGSAWWQDTQTLVHVLHKYGSVYAWNACKFEKLALNWDRFDSPAMTTLTRVKAFNSANRSFKLRVRDTDYCQR